ncbi:MAG: acyl-CoA synthetase [Microbacterium sp.]
MTSAPPARAFAVRHVQLARAAFAALAAVMITFSPDHSAAVGLAVFSGFAIATGLVHLLAVWLVYPAGRRWPSVLLAIVTLAAGMAGGLAPARTIPGYFAIVIAWAILSGIIEMVAGIRGLSTRSAATDRPGYVEPWAGDARPEAAPRSESRDALVTGILTLVLGLALLCVPAGYALQYTIEDANATFTLTGIIIGVGILGGYTAILAVYLGIAGFSPRQPLSVATEAPGAAAEPKDVA